MRGFEPPHSLGSRPSDFANLSTQAQLDTLYISRLNFATPFYDKYVKIVETILPATYNINIDQGGTFSLTISAKDSANNNIFASALSAKAQVRESIESDLVLAEMDCNFAANNSSLTVSLTPLQTATLNTKSMKWDLRVTWPDKVEYILEGKASLNFSVTRD